MPSYDTVSGVMDFLGSYRKAFENYDTDTILDHYVFPCTIISDAEKVTPSLLRTKEAQGRRGLRPVAASADWLSVGTITGS